MASVFLVGMLIGRRVDVYNSLGIAALFILIRNPKELFNVGFQLSFLAVLSILFFAPKFTKLISKNTNFYVNKFLYTPFLVSVSAWLGTCIPILYYFKIITPIAIISNIFVVPLVFVLLIGGMGFLLLGWVPFIGPFLAGFNAILANLMFSLTDFFASFRFGHWYL
jgi:competence protein ComEC